MSPGRSTSPRRRAKAGLRSASKLKIRVRNRARKAVKRAVVRLPDRVRGPVITTLRRVDQTALRRRDAGGGPRPGPRVDHPAIAVVIPSRNRAELIGVALRSVQMQDFTSFECIVVDNDSTDDAVLVTQSFAAVDPRFRVLLHDTAQGPSAARNAGIAAARAPFVCFLDDDDFLLAGSLRARHRCFRGQPDDVVGVLCDWINTDPGVGLEAFEPKRRPKDRGIVSLGSLRDGAPFILTSPLLRTDVLRAVGGFDERFDRAEDTELWFRVARLGYRFVDARHVGVAYRRTPGSLVTGAPTEQLDSLLEVFRRSELPDHSSIGRGPMPAPEPLSAVAVSHARSEQILRYVALIAMTDPDRAVADAIRGIHPLVRRALDVDALVPRLRSYAATRLALRTADLPAAEAAIRDVIARIVPPIETRVEPLVDVAAWTASVAARTCDAAAPPRKVQAGVAGLVDGAVILVPEARYHVDELGPLADALTARGVTTRFMVSPKTVPAALAELGRYSTSVLPYLPEAIGRARAVVTLNDWGPLKELLRTAAAAGVPTFAKVEGVQDFDDVESTWDRSPYRTAAYILAQGDNDVAGLPEKETFVVGSSRLERLWMRAPVVPGDHALVNMNFTFQVLIAQRDRWLDSVRQGLSRSKVAGLVSTHPAERGDVVGLPVAAKPFRHEIMTAGLLVSRFSTVPFEAMARGVPFVYHNPHGERFPAFLEPGDAFPVTADADQLTAAVREVLGWRSDYRERSARFFLRQVDVDERRTSAARGADVIVGLV